MTDKEANERLSTLMSVIVENPLVEYIYKQLDRMRIEKRCAKIPSAIKHVFLLGVSGVGKSVFSKCYLERNPPDEKVGKVPVAYVEVQDEFKPEELYTDILDALGVEQFIRDRQKLKKQVIGQLQNHQTELLFLDEFQNVLAREKDGMRIMRTLKHIANKAGVVLVCIGTPEVATLRTVHLQLFRRFKVLVLDRFSCDDIFIRVLSQFEKGFGLNGRSRIADPDSRFPEVIHKMTMGIMHYVRALLIKAAEIAIEEFQATNGKEVITVKHLKKAYVHEAAEFMKLMQDQVLKDEEYINEILKLQREAEAS